MRRVRSRARSTSRCSGLRDLSSSRSSGISRRSATVRVDATTPYDAGIGARIRADTAPGPRATSSSLSDRRGRPPPACGSPSFVDDVDRRTSRRASGQRGSRDARGSSRCRATRDSIVVASARNVDHCSLVRSCSSNRLLARDVAVVDRAAERATVRRPDGCRPAVEDSAVAQLHLIAAGQTRIGADRVGDLVEDRGISDGRGHRDVHLERVAIAEDILGDPPHLDELAVPVQDALLCGDEEDPVERGFALLLERGLLEHELLLEPLRFDASPSPQVALIISRHLRPGNLRASCPAEVPCTAARGASRSASSRGTPPRRRVPAGPSARPSPSSSGSSIGGSWTSIARRGAAAGRRGACRVKPPPTCPTHASFAVA